MHLRTNSTGDRGIDDMRLSSFLNNSGHKSARNDTLQQMDLFELELSSALKKSIG